MRGMRVELKEIAEHGAALHGLDDVASAWFREGLVCAGLMSAWLDEGERLTLQVQATHPRFAFTADVDYDGGVRARLSPPTLPGGQMPGSGESVEGVLLVLKSVVGREVYRGATEVDHDSFAAMLHDHFEKSAQAPARIRVEGARGAFVERLAGTDHDDDLDVLFDDAEVDVLDARAQALLEGFEPGDETVRQPLFWRCSCSRERVMSMLAALEPAAIRDMIETDGGAVVTCNFCTREVVVDADGLRSLLA
jgi:molecular chaperone Hsp33